MKKLVSKLFPKHDLGTAATILFFLFSALVMAGYAVSDEKGEGAFTAQYVLIGAFVAIAGGVYAKGKKDQRVGK